MPAIVYTQCWQWTINWTFVFIIVVLPLDGHNSYRLLSIEWRLIINAGSMRHFGRQKKIAQWWNNKLIFFHPTVHSIIEIVNKSFVDGHSNIQFGGELPLIYNNDCGGWISVFDWFLECRWYFHQSHFRQRMIWKMLDFYCPFVIPVGPLAASRGHMKHPQYIIVIRNSKQRTLITFCPVCRNHLKSF